MLKKAYSLTDVNYVNVVTQNSTSETVTTINKNLKYNGKKDYKTAFERITNLYNALSSDSVKNVEIVETISSLDLVNSGDLQILNTNNEVIPDNTFYFPQTETSKKYRFKLVDSQNRLFDLDLVSLTKKTSYGSIPTNSLRVDSFNKGGSVSNPSYYELTIKKGEDEITVDEVYAVKFYVLCKVNMPELIIKIIITE